MSDRTYASRPWQRDHPLLMWADHQADSYDMAPDSKRGLKFLGNIGITILILVCAHDLLNPKPHDGPTWAAHRQKLEARLAHERAHAPEEIEALVRRGRDLESAKYLVGMRLRKLAADVRVARDSTASYRSAWVPTFGD